MKILYLAHRIPYPPNKGEKIRSFHEIRFFSGNHQVHLIAFYDQADEKAHAAALSQYCSSVTLVRMHPRLQYMRALHAMLQGRPWTLGYFWNREMEDKIHALVDSHSFDLAFAYSSAVASYLSDCSIMKILDFVDSDANKWRQYAQRKRPSFLYSYEAKHMDDFERQMLDKFDHCVFVSAREASHMGGGGKIHFINNGIDLEFYNPGLCPPAGQNIVFTGAMNYYPNVDAVTSFARQIFPRVRKQLPDTRFLIVGARPTGAVRALARIAGVTVLGAVPDVRPHLANARVAVAPLRIAQGIQNKVLEALAMGLPVVCTPAAAEGLDALDMLPVQVADSPDTFASQVLEQLLRPQRTSHQVAETREVLGKYYSWSANLSKFDALFHSRGEITH